MATTARYAEGTTVSVESSQTEARRLLKRFGADQTRITDAEDRALVEFTLRGRLIRFLVEAPAPDPRRPAKEALRLAQQEYKRRWRALLLRLKGKLESVVNEGVEVEEEFLGQLVVYGGRTVGEILLPQIDEVYRTGQVPSLLPPSGALALPAHVTANGEEVS